MSVNISADYAELLTKVIAPGADEAAANEFRKRLAWKAFQVRGPSIMSIMDEYDCAIYSYIMFFWSSL